MYQILNKLLFLYNKIYLHLAYNNYLLYKVELYSISNINIVKYRIRFLKKFESNNKKKSFKNIEYRISNSI